jgi:hypothetical protein
MKRQFFVAAASVLIVGTASGAFAQGSSRPYQGLFGGGGAKDPAVHHTLDVNLSIAAAYDDDALPSLIGGIDPTQRPLSGYNTSYAVSAQYGWQGRHMQAGLSGVSTLRQYVDFNDYNMTHSVAAGFSAQFARRTTVFVNQTADYSPPYLFGLFPSVETPKPGVVVSGGPNYVVNDTESLSYQTIATVEHGLTRRGTVALTGDHRYTDFRRNDTGRPDVSSSGARLQYGYGLGRNAAFTAGYHYRSGQLGFGTLAVSSEQGLDVGIAYTRKLSPSRRATFNFSVGSSRVELPDAPAAGIIGGRQMGVSADAGLNYEFAREWVVRGAYRRGAEFVAELIEPIFAEGVTLSLNGYLTRRLHLQSSAAYSTGESIQIGTSPNLTTYTGNVQLGYAFARSLGAYVEYLYYYYNFTGSTQLAPGLLTGVERNGVRVGLTYSFSLRRR